MKRIKYMFASVLVTIFGCTVMLFVDVQAETVKNSLTVSPQHQKIVLVPGETFEGIISISSQASSDVDTYYEVSVAPFSRKKGADSKDDYGEMDYINKSTYNQIVDWFEFDVKEGKVSPNETKNISFKINVPKDAPAGGQYASIVVRDAKPNVAESDGIAVKSVLQILSLVYAEVAGETRQTAEIIDNSLPSFLLNGPIEASSMVKNTGNVHTDTKYTLQVWPLFSGEEICTNEEEPETSIVMPGTERYHVQSCELPSFGIFRAKQTVKIFGETSIAEKTIIICPLWLLFVIVVVLVALIFWAVFSMRSRKRANGSSKSDNE